MFTRSRRKPTNSQTPPGPSASGPTEGLPEDLRGSTESLSGMNLGDVSVHRNSARPALIGAEAYAQGSDIYLGPGADRHLPHEAWHVVQQMRHQVPATDVREDGLAVNLDPSLEREAQTYGAKAAASSSSSPYFRSSISPASVEGTAMPTTYTRGTGVVQGYFKTEDELLGSSRLPLDHATIKMVESYLAQHAGQLHATFVGLASSEQDEGSLAPWLAVHVGLTVHELQSLASNTPPEIPQAPASVAPRTVGAPRPADIPLNREPGTKTQSKPRASGGKGSNRRSRDAAAPSLPRGAPSPLAATGTGTHGAPASQALPLRAPRHAGSSREARTIDYDFTTNGPSRDVIDYRPIDPRDVRTLISQRESQRDYLQAGIKRSREAVLALATDNMLVRKEKYPRALAFLDREDKPDISLFWLGKYLALLDTFMPRRPAGRNRPVQDLEIESRIEDVAHYLVKAEWLSGGSDYHLGHLANRLSKFERVPAALGAIEWIAHEVTDEESTASFTDPKVTALLLNAFSKLPGEPREMALSGVAKRLLDNTKSLHGLSGQSLSMFLNAFSRCANDPSCSRVAQVLAAKIQAEPLLVKSLDAHGVSNVLGALAKWPEDEACRMATEKIAARVGDDEPMRKAMTAQGVSNALNALVRGGLGADSQGAHRHLIMRLESDRELRNSLNAQELASVLNVVSKWPRITPCIKVAQALVARLEGEPELARGLQEQSLANVLNALSKWPEAKPCRNVANTLAKQIASRSELQAGFNEQEVSNVLAALAKWSEAPNCKNAALALMKRIANDPLLVSSFNEQEAVQALNALRMWAKEASSVPAARSLTSVLVPNGEPARRLTGGHVSLVANALGHWPQDAVCRNAALTLVERLGNEGELVEYSLDSVNALSAMARQPDAPEHVAGAREIARRLLGNKQALKQFGVREIAGILAALGKWPEDETCAELAAALTARIVNEKSLREAFAVHQMSGTLNVLGKMPELPGSADAARELAKHLAQDESLLGAMNSEDISNTLNALSNWRAEPASLSVAGALGQRISEDDGLRAEFNDQGLANTLAALSQWPEDERCVRAGRALAQALVDRREALVDPAKFGARSLATLANALSRWPREPACVAALQAIVESIFEGGRQWPEFNMVSIAQLANAISRLHSVEADSADDLQALSQSRLHTLAAHLDTYKGELLGTASSRHIGIIFKALGSARMQKAMKPLVPAALARLHALIDADGLRGENLESLGTLCMGLVPVLRSPDLVRHREAALKLMNRLQPIADRKLGMLLEEADPEPGAGQSKEQFDTRRPALSFVHLLKSFSIMRSLWKTRWVDSPRTEVLERRAELGGWIEHLLDRTRDTVTSDLQEMSWNLIAQIEVGDDIFDALDARMRGAETLLTANSKPIPLELDQLQAGMKTTPGTLRAVQEGEGAPRYTLIDMRGNTLKSDEADGGPQYSFYSRLTGQPVTEVKLPGPLSPFMLARTITHHGEQWRFDMFGGSHLKVPSMRPQAILAGSKRGYGRLPAIRYSDSAPTSPFMKLVSKLGPQREDWSRIQRSLLETVPVDHAVEGTLRIGWFPDVPGPEHPFKPVDPASGEDIALCPNDGCGFLRYEAAMQIPAVARLINAWNASRTDTADTAQRKLIESFEQEPSYMSPQALQHFPRDEAAVEEARGLIEGRLNEIFRTATGSDKPPVLDASRPGPLTPENVTKLQQYRLLVNGGYEGRKIRAVPSADDNLHLPGEKGRAFDEKGGDVLLGKPPYDKENLLPIEAARVKTTKTGDLTAKFLENDCFAIQYSYAGFDDAKQSDADILHSKGMLIIPPKGAWPKAYADLDLACSTEDMKTLSAWTESRARPRSAVSMTTTGSLRVKDLLLPGELGAVPIRELRKRDMDTDGDDAYVFAGYPKLTELITRVVADRARRKGEQRSFKPQKTAQTAYDADRRYHAGRARNIIDAQQGDALVGKASMAATRFMAQPDALREKIAEDWMFGTYEGTERELRNALRELIADDVPDLARIDSQLEAARRAVDHAHHPVAKEVAQRLRDAVEGWRRKLSNDDAKPPAALGEKLQARFPELAERYGRAQTPVDYIEAILDHYPVCRLLASTFPEGRPGYVKGETELTARNLLTLAVKVGTDALKSNTGTETFMSVMALFERVEKQYDERVRNVPYGKQTARLLRDDRFDADAALEQLRNMPSMAAAVMETSIEQQQRFGLLTKSLTPQDRISQTATLAAIDQEARRIRAAAERVEQVATPLMQGVIGKIEGASLQNMDHRLKSVGSLREKLKRFIGVRGMSLGEASVGVNDAVRYSVVFDAAGFGKSYAQAIEELARSGMSRVKVVNHFRKPVEAFNAVSVTGELRVPNERGEEERKLVEIQFHTQESFGLKEASHEQYKQSHALELAGRHGERAHLLEGTLEKAKAMPRPEGWLEIDDWSREVERPKRSSPKPAASSGVANQGPAMSKAREMSKSAGLLEKTQTPRIETLVKAVGGDWADSKYWRSSLLKKPASIARKIMLIQRESGLPLDEAARQVHDALRYTVKLDAKTFTASALRLLDSFAKHDLKVMRVRNAFVDGDGTYRGINIKLRTQDCMDFEVQLHTEESFRAKYRNHEHYEALRKLSSTKEAGSEREGTDGTEVLDAERARLLNLMRERARDVEIPAGVGEIKAFSLY